MHHPPLNLETRIDFPALRQLFNIVVYQILLQLFGWETAWKMQRSGQMCCSTMMRKRQTWALAGCDMDVQRPYWEHHRTPCTFYWHLIASFLSFFLVWPNFAAPAKLYSRHLPYSPIWTCRHCLYTPYMSYLSYRKMSFFLSSSFLKQVVFLHCFKSKLCAKWG